MADTQQPKPNAGTHYIIAIACGVWFALTGGLWAYLANVFISFPVALLGLYFWKKARKIDPENKLNKTTKIIYVIGATVSIVILLAMMVRN